MADDPSIPHSQTAAFGLDGSTLSTDARRTSFRRRCQHHGPHQRRRDRWRHPRSHALRKGEMRACPEMGGRSVEGPRPTQRQHRRRCRGRVDRGDRSRLLGQVVEVPTLGMSWPLKRRRCTPTSDTLAILHAALLLCSSSLSVFCVPQDVAMGMHIAERDRRGPWTSTRNLSTHAAMRSNFRLPFAQVLPPLSGFAPRSSQAFKPPAIKNRCSPSTARPVSPPLPLARPP